MASGREPPSVNFSTDVISDAWVEPYFDHGAGNVVVIDNYNVFSEAGEFVRAFGRRGSSTGEQKGQFAESVHMDQSGMAESRPIRIDGCGENNGWNLRYLSQGKLS